MEPTIQLYDTNSYLATCNATVLSCTYDEKRKAYGVVLDRTVFFPEQGGQFADLGYITKIYQSQGSDARQSTEACPSLNSAAGQSTEACPSLNSAAGQHTRVSLSQNSAAGQYTKTSAESTACAVSDVQVHDEVITHYVDKPLTVGTLVTCSIDWVRRFDFMQQHTAEHILSGLVHKRFGYNNVGFHLGLTETTLDFDGPLTAEEIADLEYRANKAVWENIPVEVTFPDSQALAALDYRSKKELTGAVRIVTLPDYDVCACCAPHVKNTGEIGMIKIVSYMAHRGGMRLTILCGSRALKDYQSKQTSVEQISSLLSAKQPDVASAVAKAKESQLALTLRINALQKMVLEAELKGLPSPEKTADVFLFAKDLDTKAIRDAVNELISRYAGYCGIFVGDSETGYSFVLGSASKDCRKAAAALKEAFGAKGGGAPGMIQGSVKALEYQIREVLNGL